MPSTLDCSLVPVQLRLERERVKMLGKERQMLVSENRSLKPSTSSQSSQEDEQGI